jgi:hypothetical protein
MASSTKTVVFEILSGIMKSRSGNKHSFLVYSDIWLAHCFTQFADHPCTNCYIVDWDDWRESTDKDVWQNTEYISWNLAWVRSHNYDDMSTWTL